MFQGVVLLQNKTECVQSLQSNITKQYTIKVDLFLGNSFLIARYIGLAIDSATIHHYTTLYVNSYLFSV